MDMNDSKDFFGTLEMEMVSSEGGQSTSDIDEALVRTMRVLNVAGTPQVGNAAQSISSECKSPAVDTRLDAAATLLKMSQTVSFIKEEVLARIPNKGEVASVKLHDEPSAVPELLSHVKREREETHDQRLENPKKYVSLAEAVLKFQFKTPKRFHSRMPGDRSLPRNTRALVPTVPRSPHLTAGTRARQVLYPSREEREEAEFEEMSRHKILPQPLNPQIFQSPKLGKRIPKFTNPEPFKLTEIKKKEPEEVPAYKFTAQPVPRNILAPKCLPVASPRPSSHTRRRLDHPKVFAPLVQVDKEGEAVIVQKEVFNFGVPIEARKNTPLKKSTEIQPFSFEERDKEMARRKEERIRMVFEQEKQARIFRAHPVPNQHRKWLGSIQDLSIMSSDTTFQAGSDENKNPAVFKAAPASVLKKEPFVPHRLDRPPLKPQNLTLKTELRSKERKEFDEKVQAEMEQLEELRKEYRERKRLEAEAEALAQRKLAERFRAQPIPKFNTPKRKFSDKKLTSPETPFAHRSKKADPDSQ
ncbi:targeting protein for Xklp2-like isoform X2 [Bacillus rossius redtenbacheri]